VREWWPKYKRLADEEAVRKDTNLLFLPFPLYVGSTALPGWDTFFTNLGLLKYGLTDAARDHVLNQLFLIQRFGYVPNGNQLSVLTRSHPPLWAENTRRYVEATRDRDVLLGAYPLLAREHRDFWSADHHSTPIGLTTNRDLGDTAFTPELVAEAETGLDFTPIFGGDVRRCVPLQTNAILVNYEQVLEWMAREIGRGEEASGWRRKWKRRSALLQRYCWSEKDGFFFEYDYEAGKRLPYWSVCAYWTMWAGIATKKQAEQLVRHLDKFEQAYGLTFTDKPYPDPHEPQNPFWSQWQYPTGWPPVHVMVVEALQNYGYRREAQRIAKKYVDLMSDLYFNRGGIINVTGNKNESDSAPVLQPEQTFGQSFTASQPFSRVGGRFPTWTTTGAGMRLTLRREGPDGEVLGSKRFDNVYDNSWLYVEVDELPAGRYYLEQSDPVGTIAWYTSSKDAYDGGSAFVDGASVPGDRVFSVEQPSGEGTGELWEKYNVVDGSLELPPAHYGEIWINQGWSYGAAAVLGRVAYGK
jgi:alpha,alpha-trehalase